MTQPAISGSRTFVGGARGEGPWVMSFNGHINVDVVAGDKWIIWVANAMPPVLTGPAIYQNAPGSSQYFGAQVWIICATGAGSLSIDSPSCSYWEFLIHKTPIYIGDLDTLSAYCD